MTDPIHLPAIIPLTKRDLVGKEVSSYIRILPRHGMELGVTERYILQLLEDFGLSVDDALCLIDIRVNFHSKFNVLKSLLAKDLLPEEIYALYELREYLYCHERNQREVKNEYIEHISWKMQAQRITLSLIYDFVRCFPALSLTDDCLGDQIIDWHEEVQHELPWNVAINQTLRTLTEIAQNFQIADVETALDAIRERSSFTFNKQDKDLDATNDWSD